MSTISTFQFSDFESFREVLSVWDTDPVQLGSGPLRIRWDALDLPGFSAANLEVNRHITDVSAYSHDTIGFVVTYIPHLWCGLEIPPGSLVVVGGGRELRATMRHGFRSFEISVSKQTLVEACILPDEGTLDRVTPENSVIALGALQVAAFDRLARELSYHAGGSLSAEEAAAFETRTLDVLRIALRRSRVPGLQHVHFHDLSDRALRVIAESEDERLSVTSLARTLGVTPRALEYAFKSATGLATSRFLQAYRLNNVRRDLMNRDENVATCATRYGFHHLGRFSGQYHRLFGELPSHTRQHRENAREALATLS